MDYHTGVVYPASVNVASNLLSPSIMDRSKRSMLQVAISFSTHAVHKSIAKSFGITAEARISKEQDEISITVSRKTLRLFFIVFV
jgi:hypothetical protein